MQELHRKEMRQETAAEQWDSALTRSFQVQKHGALAQLGERLHGMNPLHRCPAFRRLSRFFEFR
jgi:hypothetical protein